MQIGSIDGSAETTFGDNLTAKLLPGGQIAVVDLQQREIRLFDGNTGAFIRVIGRAGKGPGEFGAAPTIAAAEGGRIWAFDRSNRRLLLFDLDGRLLRERTFTPTQMRGIPNSYVPNAFYVSTAGNVLSAADDARGPGLKQQKVAVLSSNDAAPIQIGSAVSTQVLLRHTDARTNSYYGITDPFRSHRSAAMAASRIYVSHHDAWQINVYDTRGDLQEIIRASIPRVRITSQLKARERTRHARMGPQFARLFDQLELADSASAIGEIKISADGTLWVARWRPPDRRDDQLFDLLNAKGEWLVTVRVPAATGEVADVSAGKLLNDLARRLRRAVLESVLAPRHALTGAYGSRRTGTTWSFRQIAVLVMILLRLVTILVRMDVSVMVLTLVGASRLHDFLGPLLLVGIGSHGPPSFGRKLSSGWR